MKIMKRKVVTAATSNENPNSIIDEIVYQLEAMMEYAQDMIDAINSNDGEVYDVEELRNDANNIMDTLGEAYQDMGKMAKYQKIFKF